MTVKEFNKTIDWYVNNLGFSVKSKTEIRERGTRMAFLEAGGFAMLEIFGFIDSSRPVQGARAITPQRVVFRDPNSILIELRILSP
jgi:catechol 2,3-dioxygenase-like lactoylglutathione lyase family enzyme